MQSVSTRIWTCVAVSISYGDNHYTMGTMPGGIYLYFSNYGRLLVNKTWELNKKQVVIYEENILLKEIWK